MRTLFDDIWAWSVYSKQKRLDFNGHVLRGEDATVLVDPPALEEEDLEKLLREPAPFHVLLTNKDHWRESEAVRRQLEAEVWIHEADAGLLERAPDHTFIDGQDLPGGVRALHVPDSKSPGETALYLRRHDGVLILGDALIGYPVGEVSLLPDDKYADPARAREGIRVLLEPSYQTLLVGDGISIFRNGRDAVQRFLERDPSAGGL
jgi:hypothetical protein